MPSLVDQMKLVKAHQINDSHNYSSSQTLNSFNYMLSESYNDQKTPGYHTNSEDLISSDDTQSFDPLPDQDATLSAINIVTAEYEEVEALKPIAKSDSPNFLNDIRNSQVSSYLY